MVKSIISFFVLIEGLFVAILLCSCSALDPSSLDFELTGMSPNSGSSKKDVAVVIHGRHFYPQAEHRLESNGGLKTNKQFYAILEANNDNKSTVVLEQVEYIDEVTLSAIVPKGIASAVYTLSVTDPYGNIASLSSAYFPTTTGAVLEGTLAVSSNRVILEDNVDIILQISNVGDAAALSVEPSTPIPISVNQGEFYLLASPQITSVNIAPGVEYSFIWTYQAVNPGTVIFTGDATALSEDSNESIALSSVSSPQIEIVECLVDDDCVSDKPWCNPETGLCVVCFENSHCQDGDPCTTGEECVQNTCEVGQYDKDGDGDGFIDIQCGGDDCDDDPNECGASCNPGSMEICDGIDNDCNVATQDGDGDLALNQPCDGDDGDLCREGTYTDCQSGTLVCSDNTSDNIEICDGIDNDCNVATQDGADDPLIYVACDVGDVDLCDDGTYRHCSGGTLVCCDLCPGYDDSDDADSDGIPDGCDSCPDGGDTQHTPSWWNGNYNLRRQLIINETATGVLGAGYSVFIVMDTQNEIATGTMLPNGYDVRVVRFDGVSNLELDRHIIDLDTAQTQIWFMIQDDIDTIDDSYFLYFNNPLAQTPPAYWADSMGAATEVSRVYLAGDDFENQVVGTAPNGWEGSPDYIVTAEGSNLVLEVNDQSTDGDYFFAGSYGWNDVVIQGRMRAVSTYPQGAYYGFYFRAESEFNFNTGWYGMYDNNTAEVFTMRLADAEATALSSPIQQRLSWNVSPQGTSWHQYEIRLDGQNAVFILDGQEQTNWNIPDGEIEGGRIGLCAGYVEAHVQFDDIIVRQYVDPEPTVTIDPEQQICP